MVLFSKDALIKSDSEDIYNIKIFILCAVLLTFLFITESRKKQKQDFSFDIIKKNEKILPTPNFWMVI